MTDVPSQPDRDCHWPDCKDSGACDFRGHRCAPSQPDRDTAFTAWWESRQRRVRNSPFSGDTEAFAAGWDAATRAERERLTKLILRLYYAHGTDMTKIRDPEYYAALNDVFPLLGGDTQPDAHQPR